MIAYIEGRLTHKEPAYVIIDVNGVGYEIRISLQTYSALPEGEKCRLHTHFHVREDAQILYGFADRAEKKIFLDLMSVSGIGANTALMMLSSLSSMEIQQAIVSEDVRTIQSVKGIGSKTAQRVILELRDKVKKDLYLTSSTQTLPVTSGNTIRNEALSALTTLGIPRNVAEKSIDTVMKQEGSSLSLEQVIKLALKVS
ncbi:Holliday junction branch migration protein RuvA [Cytophagaceae bacterium DM2B3-1]|uniref:Holliday junction branch migration complex subunit RuvA n=1 Tax=Xanthocytophaga flava TaxID=3048013 RepID=A0AAE3QXD9_9BACT|nr:Holliday junction branch migration protein RuvA [Xanthocytophaga flavus]MDJ1467083.1 Holliday junction branch migration protein RuvA [Xanthocytophaga flavus]MDJ1484915.1 Holliday junction branch migration protein RuvA [Xanthocytophaga flavus]MDJ1497421.1 Holliday junction branch migration protein RuvA [Xanthocytophaga flavus]